MKHFFILSLCLLISQITIGQVDKDGRPVQFTDQIDSSIYDNFILTVDYLSIKDNQDNEKSALHFWDNPTNENYLEWAKSMTSYEFTAYRDGDFYMKINLSQTSLDDEKKYVYSLVKPGLGLYDKIPCSINGDITEHRAEELIVNNYDIKALIEKKESSEYLFFNGKELIILSYNDIKNEIVQIIDSDLLEEISREEKIKSNPIEYIKTETIGGELDFSEMLIGYGEKNPEEKVYLYSIALWSGAVRELGVTDINEIIDLWEEIHKQKAKKKIKNAILYGYNME